MSARPDMRPAPDEPRLGFLGLGWIGRKRLDAISSLGGVRVAALADPDAQRLEAAGQAYPAVAAVTDLDALLACDLDGVVIATPNSLHASQAIACLNAGIAVFCQKPLGVNAREAREVIEAARAADRLLGVDFCYRTVRGMRELRERILAGELGRILAVDLEFHNAYGPDKPWAYDRRFAGGGCVLDLGVHLLDLALWLQNGPELSLASSRMYARGELLAPGDAAIEDMAFAQFEQADGAAVRLACSWNAHAGTDALIGATLLGSRGGARWRNVDGSFYDFTVDVLRGRTAQRIAAPPDDWGPRALQAWVQRLRHDRSFDPQVRLVEKGAQLVEEIYRS